VLELTGTEKEDFTQTDFIKFWVAYSQMIKNQNKMSLAALMDNYTPTLKENFKIELQVENKLQADELLFEKTGILNYLRSQLRNYSIQLETIIVEQQGNSKPYTSSDKYQFMLKKNPKLESFRKAFNLDLD
jgi:DNA polymerase III subunit gamma/tau